ncbi:transcriptional repressor [Dyella sp. S184]|uniref:transcriptional repressor n=1 Tax=Dyella sp. S184 TaxID=1641862 RepID=UPI00131A6B7D|nr:transcriptional repressor [Dyella sp. S184]
MTETGRDALPAWEARCKSLGLLITVPRRAILAAMLELGTAHDAVTLLQAAREHHAATSLGTVYRLLRELEQLGLAQVQVPAHGRCHWRLHDSPETTPEQTPGNVRSMLKQVQHFLSELEKLGFAEAQPAAHNSVAVPMSSLPSHSPVDPTVDLLQSIAERFGYRLA